MYKYVLLLLLLISPFSCNPQRSNNDDTTTMTQIKEPDAPDTAAKLPLEEKQKNSSLHLNETLDAVVTLHEFGSFQEKPIIQVAQMSQVVRGKPDNANHQLLPSWLRVGENVLSNVLEQLQYLTPILYIGEELILDEFLETYPSRFENPDIPMSVNYNVPSHPKALLLYPTHFIELERFNRLQPEPYERGHYRVNHWQSAYLTSRPVIYEYIATLNNVRGQLRLEFRGDFLHTLIFIPHQVQRIDVSSQTLPTPSEFSLGEATLGDVFSDHGFFGTLKISYEQDRIYSNIDTERHRHYIDVSYQQEISWHGIPLTIHYHTDNTGYTSLDKARITAVTLFNLEQVQPEYDFLTLLADKHPTSEEQQNWLWSIYTNGRSEQELAQRGYTAQDIAQRFIFVDDRYIIYASGCCASVNHIRVETLETFTFPFFMFQ